MSGNSAITNNLAVGNNITTTNLLSTNITSNDITTNNLTVSGTANVNLADLSISDTLECANVVCTDTITSDIVNSRVYQYGLGNVDLETDLTNMKLATQTNQNDINTTNQRTTGITFSDTSGADLTTIDNNVTISNNKNLLLGTMNVKTNIDNLNTATTGITYSNSSNIDATFIDNNVSINPTKNLLIGTTNVLSAINSLNTTTIGITYDTPTDTTLIDNNVTVSTGKNLLVGSTNVGASLSSLNTITSGMSYISGTDTTTIDNNVQLTTGKNLLLGTTNVNTLLSGVSSNIQSQINTKLNINNPTFTGSLTGTSASISNYEVPFNPNGDVFLDVINNPPVKCGLVKGTGDGASYSTFNQAIVSWWSTAFIDSVFKTCKAFIDHRTGNFFTKGLVQTNDLNVDHDAIIDNNLTTEYLNVNQSATIKALTVNNDVYMASGYMSQGVNAINASITNATITNAYLTNLNVSNLQQMPCYLAGYVIGKNGTGFHPIICTVANTSNNYLNFNTTTGYLGLTNTDYGFILFPKYKLQAYRDPNFGRPYTSLYDNTNGTNPIYWQENIGDIGSWKLYYSNTEFKITGIST